MSTMTEQKQWHLATVFEMIADAIPDHTMMIHGPIRWTYRDFEDRAARMASALKKFGVGKDTKVALYLHNCPEDSGHRHQRELSLSGRRTYLPPR
jgi:acyl-CoA synthetase (AMP-forming)/AMP-acid ligase II